MHLRRAFTFIEIAPSCRTLVNFMPSTPTRVLKPSSPSVIVVLPNDR